MAVKKPENDIKVDEPKVEEPKKTQKPKGKPTADAGGFCVYVGPSIRGVILSNMIIEGTKREAVERLAGAIEKYPLIEKLIVTNKTFVEDRIKVQTAGNVLNVYYKQLAEGKSN